MTKKQYGRQPKTIQNEKQNKKQSKSMYLKIRLTQIGCGTAPGNLVWLM